MDLRDYLDILRTRWRLITVTTLLGVMAAAILSMLATPMFTSTAKVFVSVNGGQDVATALQGAAFAQDRVKSYVPQVTADVVMSTVIDDLNINTSPRALAGQIDVNNPLDTVVLEISATDASAQRAQAIANSTAEALQAQVEILEQPSADGQPLVKITITDDAPLPTSPSSPRTTINLALGFLVGLAVGVGASVLLETLDTRIKSIEVLAKHFEQPLLGVIGFDPDAGKDPLLTTIPGQSKRAESFRQVRTNLQFVDIDHRPKSIVVTSSVPREGKSTTAINLAITIAQTGQPVFLIEGDLRRPKIAEYLGIEGNAGLTDVLVGRATVDEVLQPWGTTGSLWILAAGLLPPNPSELLGSQAMSDLIKHLEKRATLIIDAPPLLPVTDAAVLTRLSGGALMVIHTGKTRREQLRTAEQSIESVGGKILGLVMNMAPARGPDSHRYGYGYQYEYKTTETRSKFADHPPVIPAGLGGLPGVNGSSTPTMPVGSVPAKTETATSETAQGEVGQDEPAPQRSAAKASIEAKKADAVKPSLVATDVLPSIDEPEINGSVASDPKQTDSKVDAGKPDGPVLTAAVPADEKVIGGPVGVPLAAAISPYGHRSPQVDLLPADTASGARFGLDDDAPLPEALAGPDEVPVGGAILEPSGVEPSPASASWRPPAPRAALDPLTAPYEQLAKQEGTDEQ